MKILGVTLGHDSSFALINDGKVIEIMEAERYFRQKRYKLSAMYLEQGKHMSGYQYVDIADLELFISKAAVKWGVRYDALAVQNQGRTQEYNNLVSIFTKLGFRFGATYNINHHLSHAALAFYTSSFPEALILSYDGAGNDGYTVFFKGTSGNGIQYVCKSDIRFGQGYNNIGYVIGINPEVCGTSSGKTMGLTAYGNLRKDWMPYAKRYIQKYWRLPTKKVLGINNFGKGHRINSIALNNIPELKQYLVKSEYSSAGNLIARLKRFIFRKGSNYELRLPNLEHPLSQDLVKTVQAAWTEELIKLLIPMRCVSKNVCIVGGCALNGITNYVIQQRNIFENTHFVPNPSDCGLSVGAALYAYYNKLKGRMFSGYGEYFSPYLGEEVFDKSNLPALKIRYPHKELSSGKISRILARLIWGDLIIGVMHGRYEIGPRALGNRSILCNPLNKNMRDILNQKVKHREWYRPFAPICIAQDSNKYFTNTNDIPYMSVICYTRQEYRSLLPSITHADGSARLQTIRKEQNPFMYETLKEFEKFSGFPVLLNTSFNPKGEPIVNFYEVALQMLETTKLDMVLIENILFVCPGKEQLLKFDEYQLMETNN